jgi:hypothetical protein
MRDSWDILCSFDGDGIRALQDLLGFASCSRSLHAATRDVVESARHILLRTYAAEGLVSHLRSLLSHAPPCDVNAADVHGYTPLMVACNKGSIECARWLLLAGADASLRSRAGETARDLGGWKSEESHDYLVEGLLDECSGEGVSRAAVLGSCLAMAMATTLNEVANKEEQAIAVEKLLADPDFAVEWTDPRGLSLLHRALRADNGRGEYAGRYVRLLLQKGAPVDHADPKYGDTPLMVASANGNAGCMKQLLEAGADRHAVNRDGETALQLARRCQTNDAVQHGLIADWFHLLELLDTHHSEPGER